MSTQPTERFSSRVADYVAARPSYPPAAVDALGLTSATRVADVGAGTGIFTRLLLDAGATVYAVEPNGAMRDAIAPHPRLTVVDAPAEATTLPAASVDLVTAAQAFHWFDRAGFGDECRRILAPAGKVAILFNDRPAGGTPFLDGYERLLETVGTDYASVNHRRLAARDFAEFFRGPHERLAFRNGQRLDLAGLRARLLSSSYAPAADDPRAPAMLDALARLFDATSENGVVEMTYETQVWIGRVR